MGWGGLAGPPLHRDWLMGAFVQNYSTDISDDVFAITPADAAGVTDGTTIRAMVRQIYVTGAGNIKFTTKAGVISTVAVPANFFLHCAITRVWATGTTATGFIGYV